MTKLKKYNTTFNDYNGLYEVFYIESICGVDTRKHCGYFKQREQAMLRLEQLKAEG